MTSCSWGWHECFFRNVATAIFIYPFVLYIDTTVSSFSWCGNFYSKQNYHNVWIPFTVPSKTAQQKATDIPDPKYYNTFNFFLFKRIRSSSRDCVALCRTESATICHMLGCSISSIHPEIWSCLFTMRNSLLWNVPV
jgi:hypothetical protein